METKTPIQLELEKSPLDFNELILINFRSKEDFQLTLEIREDYFKHFKNTPEYFDYSRPDQFKFALQKYADIMKWTRFDFYNKNFPKSCMFGYNFLFPSGVHWFLSVPLLQILASDKQLKNIIPPIQSHKMVVAYAQTELAHGSDFQSLETMATFDPSTQEFVLHNPTIRSIKFWPGELSVLSNWAVVFANLYSLGTNHGVHPFLVRIRDDENHRTMPGIEIGDVGPKLGYSTKDNGFMKFTNYRVPRDSLMARFYHIKPDGTYKKRGDEKIMYSAMMFMRGIIIYASFRWLAAALVIALRYSVIRKQFKDSKGIERPIIDYQLQQAKLIPQLGNLYAMRFTDLEVDKLYKMHEENMKNSDFSLLQELHAVLSGAKSIFTNWCLNGMEVARQACGGHGYSHYSGIPYLIGDHSPNVTLEGDNTILILQVAKYLVKNMQYVMQGKNPSPSAKYLSKYQDLDDYKSPVKTEADLRNIEELDRIFAAVSIFAIKIAAGKLLTDAKKLGNLREAWDTTSGLRLKDAGRIHAIYYAFQAFVIELGNIKHPENLNLFKNILRMYAMNHFLSNSSLLVESGVLNSAQFTLVRNLFDELLVDIRPHIMPLMEATGLDNRLLVSAIADENCKPYENLYNWAKNYSILNRIDLTHEVNRLLNPPKPVTAKL